MKNLSNDIFKSVLIDYYANLIDSDQFIMSVFPAYSFGEDKTDEIKNILYHSEKTWNELDCNLDGATKTQEKRMNAHLNSVVKEMNEVAFN
jgi:hypothetical protein